MVFLLTQINFLALLLVLVTLFKIIRCCSFVND
jgi:hypothetical protein